MKSFSVRLGKFMGILAHWGRTACMDAQFHVCELVGFHTMDESCRIFYG